jgi:predicted metal-dependent HD superfamily phosphohydrolase
MSQLIDKAKNFVTLLFENELPSNCLYHNLTHTLRVFKSLNEIIDNSTLSQKDIEVLQLTALFHDTGYIHVCMNHESESAKIASTFLKENNVEESVINSVTACILATKFDSEPQNELEKIIRDADASHFAKDYFQEASELLRQELKLVSLNNFSKNDWQIENIAVLKYKHKYYTDYAIKNWNSKKEANIQKMIDKTERKKVKEQEKKLKNELKSENPERAIQSVYRITLKNHIKLSDIADTKANILLSINAIIISIALSTLIPKLDNPSNHHLIIPTMIFLLFTVITIGLSVLATRPNVTRGKFTKEDVANKKVNLLFFGNFHKMNLEEYEWAMNEMLLDKDYIYSSMTKDLYYLGLVLHRKYSILRYTYTIFLIGIIISLLSFAIAVQVAATAT